MDIYRNTYQPVSTVDRPRVDTGKRPPPADGASAPPPDRVTDRRLQPDRRRRQDPFEGPDRRKRKSRRRPVLLDPKTGESAPLEDRRGRLVDASA
ncbi:hypothetical protein [Marinobacter sp. SS21]|uniref:hypothetical protein n=1 Tax=Marinobacter sp. SS21 TaxID=2979460 RepID=UPI00233047A5|nr:hypothetical protein [Marinobacter sp. SS21]MDC0663778.1 hypothetical protein [Marinobacter sp. SS21]